MRCCWWEGERGWFAGGAEKSSAWRAAVLQGQGAQLLLRVTGWETPVGWTAFQEEPHNKTQHKKKKIPNPVK